jgi:hypothetical protein
MVRACKNCEAMIVRHRASIAAVNEFAGSIRPDSFGGRGHKQRRSTARHIGFLAE